MKLWLIRHAQPLVAPGICYGASNIPADTTATAQAAKDLAKILPIRIPLFTSSLQRCEQLTQQLCAHRPDLRSTPEPRITEMNFGTWEMQPWAAIPRADQDAWVNDFAHYRPGGGESVQTFMRRVQAALADQLASGAEQAVWVTHAGVCRAVRLLSQGIQCPAQATEWPRAGPGFGGWECVEVDFRCFN